MTGLLRMSEPGGAFLRVNDPASDRWFSRDVAAIAASRGLDKVAPYFIDAERAPGESGLPVAGLTVIAFSNNHLVYALTWGALALMAAAGAIFVNLDLLRPGWFGPRDMRACTSRDINSAAARLICRNRAHREASARTASLPAIVSNRRRHLHRTAS